MKKIKSIALLSILLNISLVEASVERAIGHSGVFTVNEVASSLPAPNNSHFHKLNLSIVVEKGSEWENNSNIKSHLERTELSLNSCDISIGEVKTIIVQVDNQKFSKLIAAKEIYKNPVPEVTLFEKSNRFATPTMFLLKARQFYKGKAFAMTKGAIDRALRFKNDWRNLINTTFITDDKMSNRAHPNSTRTFSVVAHELGHIIGDLSHVYTNMNVMSGSDDRDSKSHHFNTDQCAAIRAHLKI